MTTVNSFSHEDLALVDILRDEFHDYLQKGGVVTALQGAFDALHTIPPRERPKNVLKFVCEHIKSSAYGGSSNEDRMMQGELDKLGELERLLLVLRQHLRLVLAAMAPNRYMGLLRGEDIPLGPLPDEDETSEKHEDDQQEEEKNEKSEAEDTDDTGSSSNKTTSLDKQRISITKGKEKEHRKSGQKKRKSGPKSIKFKD